MPQGFDPKASQKRADDAAKQAKKRTNAEAKKASQRLQKWVKGVKT